jgi:hypothetical protein
MAVRDGKRIALRLDELGDPILNRAYNRFLVEREGYRELVVDDTLYINTVSSLRSTVGKNWSVMIVVPAGDFVGFVSRNYRRLAGHFLFKVRGRYYLPDVGELSTYILTGHL